MPDGVIVHEALKSPALAVQIELVVSTPLLYDLGDGVHDGIVEHSPLVGVESAGGIPGLQTGPIGCQSILSGWRIDCSRNVSIVAG